MKTLRLVLLMLAAALVLCAPRLDAQAPAAGTLDHLLCYTVNDKTKPAALVDINAELQPEFSQFGCKVVKTTKFCVPVTKRVVQPGTTGPGIVGQPLRDDYICYLVKCPNSAPPIASKLVADQFGQRKQEKYKPFELCVPARKGSPPCAQIGSGRQCGGVCPNDVAGAPTACRYDTVLKECTCEPQPCGGKPDKSGHCGGACPDPTQACHAGVDAAGNKACVCGDPPPPPCGLNPATGTCGGTCVNPADTCVFVTTPTGPNCICQPPVPQCQPMGTAGQCGGPCPPGLTCQLNPVINQCRCDPPTQTCGQNPVTGQCGGPCPVGSLCRLITAGGAVTCACAP